MRGLKLKLVFLKRVSVSGRIFYRCVDWNRKTITTPPKVVSRIFYRCVDWNYFRLKSLMIHKSRIFYRCVDWNPLDNISATDMLSRIFYRCVDWNSLILRPVKRPWSHLLQMRGLKLHLLLLLKMRVMSRIFYRCVDWNGLCRWCFRSKLVASFTDAWIETIIVLMVYTFMKSHLLQMRGLKHPI